MRIRTVNDKEKVKEIKEKIKENDGYCPCVPEYAHNETTKCMCKEFLESPAGTECHCGLYVKEED